MEAQNAQVTEKMTMLLKFALSFYDKEISLPSNQFFSFDQIIDEKNTRDGEYNYQVQYGFPQSGSVLMNFSYFEESDSFTVDKLSVHAPSADKEFAVANFTPQTDFGGISISANFGLDMKTEEYTSLEDIEQNPNAIKMIDMAIDDLSQAEILGECMVGVPIGSNKIPLCSTSVKPLNKTEKMMK